MHRHARGQGNRIGLSDLLVTSPGDALCHRIRRVDHRGAFLAGGLAGNTAAAMLVPRLDQRHLKRLFAVFMLLVGLFTAASATGLIPIRFE